MNSFYEARTCYQHLAGELGVKICDALISVGCIHHNIIDGHNKYTLSDIGIAWTRNNGFYCANRTQVKSCIDVTHKRPHLSGTWAVDLSNFLLKKSCIERELSGRNVRVTDSGRQFLLKQLKLQWT